MIYLTLDTNIWINSLYESGKDYNFIESLEYWIEKGDVQILLPEIIKKEWERNREKHKENCVEVWRMFFNKAIKVFYAHSEVIKQLMTPENLEERAEVQIKRIENIFENSILIPITDEYKIKATELAEQKAAPFFDDKNSIGDAYIYISMIDFITKKELLNCIFISCNYKDFSKDKGSKDIIHPNLESEFTKLKIKYYNCIEDFLIAHSSQLPDISEYKKRKALKEELRKIERALLLPQPLESFTGLQDSYIEDIEHLDIILEKKTPTKKEASFALALINSEDSYKRHFLRKVDKKVWFNILKENDFFNPANNPVPIQVKGGFQIPYWEVLSYLDKLSYQIKEGNSLELTDELIAIIKNVSENPKDNHHTWRIFIRILANIPNEKVPSDIFKFIPVWLSGKFDSMFNTHEIYEHLLLKFLNEEPTADDIIKAELILHYLFKIEKTEIVKKDFWNSDRHRYSSKIHFNIFNNCLPRIVKYCSSDFVLELGRRIKFLLLDYPNGINVTIKDGDNEYEIQIYVEEENLLIFSKLLNSEDDAISETIDNYEEKSEEELKQALISLFKCQNINYSPNSCDDDVFVRLKFCLQYIVNFRISTSSIRNFTDNPYDNETVIIFSSIFRDLLVEIAKQNPNEVIRLLKLFCFDKKYIHPFYKRITLFVICESWDTTKSLFWELLENDDALMFFSNYTYQKELYDLLNKNQYGLSTEEKVIIQNIIEQGMQGEETYEKNNEYWQLRWYSALRYITPFNESYLSLSKKLNTTSERFENEGKIMFRTGSTSPFDIEELLQKSNKEIAENICTFNPKNSWEEPTIDGFANSIGKAIENEPQKFACEIDFYDNVGYIYAYYMAVGFRNAWEKKKMFDRIKVLNFFKMYLLKESFISGKLQLKNDDLGTTTNMVIGSVAALLSEGTVTDKNAFDLSLLSITKEILQIIVPILNPISEFEQMNTDYPTYLINSTAGRTLIALLNYSIWRAINLDKKSTQPKWEQDVKELLEQTLEKGIIDAFILTGLYFQRFCFLDKEWITNKVKEFYYIEDMNWLAFISGFACENPPQDKEVYKLFYPHYERFIQSDFKIKTSYERSIIRHVIILYLWNLEDLEKEGLLLQVINKNNHSNTLDLVDFIWRQDAYFESLDNEKGKIFEKKIFNLWNFLAEKYSNANSEDEQKVLAAISNFITFVPELTEEYTALLLKSCKITGEQNRTYHLLQNLNKLKDKGNPKEVAKYVGIILNSIQFNHHYFFPESEPFTDIITFLYNNGQKQMADDFCNKMAKQGETTFFIDLYNTRNK